MAQKKIIVKVKVYTEELQEFYQNDPTYGTSEKPFPAEGFYEVVSNYALFTGPLKNILKFEPTTLYTWVLEQADGTQLTLVGAESEIEMKMAFNNPTNDIWKRLFKDAPLMDNDGKIKMKGKGDKISEFTLETSDDISRGPAIKYSFTFEFQGADGTLKYGIVDPMGVPNNPPPPLP